MRASSRRSRFACNDQMAVLAVPAAGEQIADRAFVQAARRLHVEVLKARGLAQASLLQPGLHGGIGAIRRFAVDQHGKLVGEVSKTLNA